MFPFIFFERMSAIIMMLYASLDCSMLFLESSPLQHDWISTSSSNVLFHSTNHASLGTESNVTRLKLSNVTTVYSTNESSVAPVTTTDIIYVGIILIGLFVLFFGMFAVTYVYQKCFRQRANMTNLQDKNIIDQLVQYKTLDFEIGEQEPVLSESRRSRLNTDTTYLYPVFERNTSYEETHNFPQVENDDPFVEATASVQELPPNLSVNRLDQDSLESNCEPQHHVYVEILDNDVDAYENEDGNSVDNEDPTGARYSPDGKEFDYVNVDD